MTKTASHTWSEGKGRYVFLDLYRGLIVLLMLEGHVLRELLTPELRVSEWFRIHEIFHGVTAPGFLFGSGFAFAIATQRKWEQAITFNKRFLRRCWRAILLIFTGYALHVPYLSLQKSLALATQSEWDAFFAFDVLQCIGVSLLILRILLFILKKEKPFLITIVILFLSIVYLTPIVSSENFTNQLPPFLVPAFHIKGKSYFPFFPFAAYLLGGTIVSWMFLRAAQNLRESVFIQNLFFTGIALILLGWGLDALPYSTYSNYDFWHTSPNYFWIRFGILFLMMSALWYFEDAFLRQPHRSWVMPRWLTTLGMQSLFVYIAHLIILYGWVYNTSFNMSYYWKDSLTLGASSLVALLLIALMTAGAFAWRYLQKNHITYLRGLLFYFGFITVWPFLFSPN